MRSPKYGSHTQMSTKSSTLVSSESCLSGRQDALHVSGIHAVSSRSYIDSFPSGTASIVFGMGCFWGAERLFWNRPGVYVTAVGYAGGGTPNPTYEEVCSGLTNHTEAVFILYEMEKIALEDLLEVFWQEHDPTQLMRQGNDRGTQYRSAIYVNSKSDLARAIESRDRYQTALIESGLGRIETEIDLLKKFYYAEDYHQQYLHKVPNGYCGLAGTGVSCR